MRAIAIATSVAVLPDATLVVDPSPRELSQARSLHVLAFTNTTTTMATAKAAAATSQEGDDKGELLLVESEGRFTLQEWDAVLEKAKRACCQDGLVGQQMQHGLDLVLDDADAGRSQDVTDMRQFIRGTVEARVAADLYWK
jgi:exosome complex component RRP46